MNYSSTYTKQKKKKRKKRKTLFYFLRRNLLPFPVNRRILECRRVSACPITICQLKSWSRVSGPRKGLRCSSRAGRAELDYRKSRRCRPFRETLKERKKGGIRERESRVGRGETRKKRWSLEKAKCRGEYLWRSSLRRVDRANYNFPIKRSVEGMLLHRTSGKISGNG